MVAAAAHILPTIYTTQKKHTPKREERWCEEEFYKKKEKKITSFLLLFKTQQKQQKQQKKSERNKYTQLFKRPSRAWLPEQSVQKVRDPTRLDRSVDLLCPTLIPKTKKKKLMMISLTLTLSYTLPTHSLSLIKSLYTSIINSPKA